MLWCGNGLAGEQDGSRESMCSMTHVRDHVRARMRMMAAEVAEVEMREMWWGGDSSRGCRVVGFGEIVQWLSDQQCPDFGLGNCTNMFILF